MMCFYNHQIFFDTGLAELDMTKVTVALCYSGLTKVTPADVLGNVLIRLHCCEETENTEQYRLFYKLPQTI